MNTATKFEQDAIEKPKMMKINADKSLFAGTADDSSTKADSLQVSQPIAKPNVIGSRTSEVLTAADAIKELEAHADIFTCPKNILPEVFSIMDRDYTSGDFKYMIFGQTAHCKRTKTLTKRSS